MWGLWSEAEALGSRERCCLRTVPSRLVTLISTDCTHTSHPVPLQLVCASTVRLHRAWCAPCTSPNPLAHSPPVRHRIVVDTRTDTPPHDLIGARVLLPPLAPHDRTLRGRCPSDNGGGGERAGALSAAHHHSFTHAQRAPATSSPAAAVAVRERTRARHSSSSSGAYRQRR